MEKYISFTTANQNCKVFRNKFNKKGTETMKSWEIHNLISQHMESIKWEDYHTNGKLIYTCNVIMLQKHRINISTYYFN